MVGTLQQRELEDTKIISTMARELPDIQRSVPSPSAQSFWSFLLSFPQNVILHIIFPKEVLISGKDLSLESWNSHQRGGACLTVLPKEVSLPDFQSKRFILKI